MKSFVEYLQEARKQKSSGIRNPKDLRLSHLGKLSEVEQRHVEEHTNKYMDQHGMSGVAAENRVAIEIVRMRRQR